MLVYAIFVTFLLGMLAGSVLTVVVAIKSDDRDKAKADTKRRHPSSQKVGPNPFQSDILDYTNKN